MTFVVNVHDWTRPAESGDTLLRLIDLYEKHKVRGDFYLTAPVVEAYAKQRPDVVRRLRESDMTVSYHFRPPHPAYSQLVAYAAAHLHVVTSADIVRLAGDRK